MKRPFGGASDGTPRFLSPVDPAARWTRTARSGQARYSYSTNYLIDCENAIIMDVEATTAIRQAQVYATRKMIDRVKQRTSITPHRLSGDTAYGSAEMLDWLVNQRGIEPHIPVFDKSERKDGVFARDSFTFDADQDHYICPGDKQLKRYWSKGRAAKSQPPRDGTYRYRAGKDDCANRKLHTQMLPGSANAQSATGHPRACP